MRHFVTVRYWNDEIRLIVLISKLTVSRRTSVCFVLLKLSSESIRLSEHFSLNRPKRLMVHRHKHLNLNQIFLWHYDVYAAAIAD